MDELKAMLAGICTVGSILCIFAAIILFAAGKLSDSLGARGEATMIGCIIAAAAFGAAGAYISTQDLSISLGS